MRWVVSHEEAGERLDALLLRRLEDVRRTDVARCVRLGWVLLNGRPAAKGDRVAAGDEVSIERELPRRDFDPVPGDSGAVALVHVDDDVAIVEKPAGMPCHPLRVEERATVVQSVLARFPEMRGVGHARREAGLVHRLDTQTSGLLLFARNAVAFAALRQDLRLGHIGKGYLALVSGRPSLGLIDRPIANDPSDRRRTIVVPHDRATDRARAARTEIVDVRAHGAFSLVTLRASRATRHQIRVHLASEGHPLAGDVLYGGSAIRGLGRHFLHAHRMELVHPTSGKLIEADSALPEDLVTLLGSLCEGRSP